MAKRGRPKGSKNYERDTIEQKKSPCRKCGHTEFVIEVRGKVTLSPHEVDGVAMNVKVHRFAHCSHCKRKVKLIMSENWSTTALVKEGLIHTK